jgi:hypothetical protein
VIDTTCEDPVEKILKLTGGRGVDVAIEALGRSDVRGAPARAPAGRHAVEPRRVLADLKIPLDAFAAGLGDHRIVTTLCPGGKERMRRLMNVIAGGRMDLGPMVTHRFRARRHRRGLRPVREPARRRAEGCDHPLTDRGPRPDRVRPTRPEHPMTEHSPSAPLDYRARSDGPVPGQPDLPTRRAIAIVLAGGRGTRLRQLTDRRAKPAVPFAGKLKIIDFALSNCVNSGIRRIGVLTQYKAQSLIRHVERGWGFLAANLGEYVDVVPAQQRLGETWYAAPPTPSTRTSTCCATRGPRTCWCSPATTSTRWTTAVMLAEHVRPAAPTSAWPASRCRWPRRRDFGVMASTPTGASSPSTRSPPIRKRCPASSRPRAGQHGHLRVRRRLPGAELARDARRPSLQPRLRQGPDPAPVARGARVTRTASRTAA